MPMPASGCIALRNCISGIKCSSISCAVTGTVGPVGGSSLAEMSICAGKSAPHSMSEFYCYSSGIGVYFYKLSQTGIDGEDMMVCACYALCTTATMPVGHCYNICLNWSITKASSIKTLPQLICVTCNSDNVYSCSVSTKAELDCGGSWGPMVVDYDDTVRIIHCVNHDSSPTMASEAITSIMSVSGVVGSYCLAGICNVIDNYASGAPV